MRDPYNLHVQVKDLEDFEFTDSFYEKHSFESNV